MPHHCFLQRLIERKIWCKALYKGKVKLKERVNQNARSFDFGAMDLSCGITKGVKKLISSDS